METISFAIGGVFLAIFAILLGSNLRNLAPGAAGEFLKPALIVIGIVLACFGGKDWAMNTVYGWLGRNPSQVVLENAREKDKAAVAPAAPAPKAHAGGARISAEFVSGPEWKSTAPNVPSIAPASSPEPEPPSAAEPQTPDAQPGKVKKVAKSVGRFFHIGHKKDSPAQDDK